MAKCYRAEIIHPVKYETILHLTDEEAGVLLTILNSVGGHPNGPRGVIEEIRVVLFDSGAKALPRGSVSGGVY